MTTERKAAYTISGLTITIILFGIVVFAIREQNYNESRNRFITDCHAAGGAMLEAGDSPKYWYCMKRDLFLFYGKTMEGP